MYYTEIALTVIGVLLLGHVIILGADFRDMEKFSRQRHAELMQKLDELIETLIKSGHSRT